MKRFQYTLQPLLTVKISLEKQRKAELLLAQNRLNAFRQELLDTEEVYADCRGEFRRMSERGASRLDYAVYQNGFRALRETMAAQKKKIEVAENECKRLRHALIEVQKERKMLENLKERKYEEYKYEAAREDARVMDDYMSFVVDTKR